MTTGVALISPRRRSVSASTRVVVHNDHGRAMKLERYAEAAIPTRHGPFTLLVYRTDGGEEHTAIVRGPVRDQVNVLTRVHSECWTSEVIGSLKCDCREQLEVALERVAAEGSGVVVYLRQEGRGIGLGNKVRAYALQNAGADTVEANLALGFDADLRQYDIAAAILADLGVGSIRLLTNNPLKVTSLQKAGVKVVERISHWVGENRHNAGYIATKRQKMGHHPDELAARRKAQQLAKK